MTITETEIFDRLTALHMALVEKLGAQPWSEPGLSLRSDGQCYTHLYDCGPYRTNNLLYTAKGETVVECLAAAEAFIAAMPCPEAKAKRDWHRKLGDVIDEGHGLALPDDVMQPLRAASGAMYKNLLAAPEVSL